MDGSARRRRHARPAGAADRLRTMSEIEETPLPGEMGTRYALMAGPRGTASRFQIERVGVLAASNPGCWRHPLDDPCVAARNESGPRYVRQGDRRPLSVGPFEDLGGGGSKSNEARVSP